MTSGTKSPRTVIFLHIPKTAGVAVENALLSRYAPGEVFLFGNASGSHGGRKHAPTIFKRLTAQQCDFAS